LIWPQTFDARLAGWNFLREQCQNLPVDTALEHINAWWFGAPWRPYYLHWDDQKAWPDPWQLLSDNIYCEVARGLGILYTITLLDRADMAPARLVLTDRGRNLVLAAKEKYILNWDAGTIVNTNQAGIIQQQYQQPLIA
jgi:hypothetical protein